MKTKLRLFAGSVVTAALLIGMVCKTHDLVANSPPRVLTSQPGSHPSDPDRPKQQFLLLYDGRIVEGVVQERETSFIVSRSGGRIVYNKANVATVADDVLSLYYYRRERIPVGDLSERLKLSRWCLSNHLREQAQAEIEGVLAIDPNHAEAKRRLRSFVRNKSGLIKPSAKETGREILPDPNIYIARFIEGNGEQTFHEFTQLETLLVNRCGSSGCHGHRHDGDFRLYHRPGHMTDQRLTARNLQSTLAMIDVAEPHKSTLLTKVIVPHGRQKVPSFGGMKDPRFIELQRWVYSVAANAGSRHAKQVLDTASDDRNTPIDGGSLEFPRPDGVAWQDGALRPASDRPDARSTLSPPLADDAPSQPVRRRPILPPGTSNATVWDDLKPEPKRSSRPTVPSKPRSTGQRRSIADPFNPALYNKSQSESE